MSEFRKNFGRIKKILDIPNLIDIQKKSYEKFLQKEVTLGFRVHSGAFSRSLTSVVNVHWNL
jgi:DNA-directed RNA polymerase subunit beta